jgi:hypothetical protein
MENVTWTLAYVGLTETWLVLNHTVPGALVSCYCAGVHWWWGMEAEVAPQ